MGGFKIFFYSPDITELALRKSRVNAQQMFDGVWVEFKHFSVNK